MRTVILYQSSTGSTKQYAEDIANSVGGFALPLKRAKWKQIIRDFDTVIYGGWVMGGNIQGINDFFQHYEDIKDKNVIIFSVGMAIPSKEGRDSLIEQNYLYPYHVRFYQLQGSFDFSKLNFFHRLMMKNSIRATLADPNTNDSTKQMMASIETTPLEYYDKEGVAKIISVLEKLSAIPLEEEK